MHAAVPANTFAIYGNGEDKELTELVPGILNQLGPDSLASLRKLAESYQSMQQKEGRRRRPRMMTSPIWSRARTSRARSSKAAIRED